LVELIRQDARATIAVNREVTYARYASYVDEQDRAAQAAMEAHASSLYELSELPWSEAMRIACEEAGSHKRASSNDQVRAIKRRYRRAAMTSVIGVPVVSVAAVIMLLSMLVMGFQWRAAVAERDAAYQRGRHEAAAEKAEELALAKQEIELRIERYNEFYKELISHNEEFLTYAEMELERGILEHAALMLYEYGNRIQQDMPGTEQMIDEYVTLMRRLIERGMREYEARNLQKEGSDRLQEEE
jgi:hypothetical protein